MPKAPLRARGAHAGGVLLCGFAHGESKTLLGLRSFRVLLAAIRRTLFASGSSSTTCGGGVLLFRTRKRAKLGATHKNRGKYRIRRPSFATFCSGFASILLRGGRIHHGGHGVEAKRIRLTPRRGGAKRAWGRTPYADGCRRGADCFSIFKELVN